MADLDYVKVAGRWRLIVADGDDEDDLPDPLYITEGTVEFTPLLTYSSVPGAVPEPLGQGKALIKATIDSEGYLTRNGKRFVWLVDLTSDKINPRISDSGRATYRVAFKNMKASDGTPVDFPGGTVRIAPDQYAPGEDVCHLPLLLPLNPGTGTPITQGRPGRDGVGITDVDVEGNALRVTFDDETERDVPLPVAMVNSAAFVKSIATRKLITELDLREWIEEGQLDNDEDGDNFALFTQVMSDLRSLYDSDGLVRQAVVPAGRYAFGSRLTPPAGAGGVLGGFGIRGEGAQRTKFLAPAFNSWLGIDQYRVGDPDWAAEDMLFEDFTVDGSAQPIGSSYVSGLKGFILHNIRRTRFHRLRVENTHATAYGIDYSDDVWIIGCEAINAGRGRLAHSPDPTTRFGSGSGYGIGFGQKQDESVYIVSSVARGCGASGIFGEQLAQPEAGHKSIGLIVANCLVEGNAIGMNDTGTRGTQVTGLVSRRNAYAGYRVGISNASEQGGIDGQVKGLTAYANLVGIAMEGSAEGGYLFDGVEVFENARAGVEFRDTINAWPGRNIRFRAPHIHHNGGPGILGSTPNPIVGLQATDVLIHDNEGDAISFTSPLSRPRITGRVFGNGGQAFALRGPARTERPVVDLDIHGSLKGYLNEHTIDDPTNVNVHGNPPSVQQLVTQTTPPAGVTGWGLRSVTATREAGGPVIDGVEVDFHVLGIATGNSPGIVGAAVARPEKSIVTVSCYALAPKGKNIAPAVRTSLGGTDYRYGPMVRATGEWQRLSYTLVVPDGATSLRPGVMGVAGATAWAAGDELRVTALNITAGGTLWPYTPAGTITPT